MTKIKPWFERAMQFNDVAVYMQEEIDELREALATRDAKLVELEESLITEDMKMAVQWAPSSPYWSEQLISIFGPNARDGINALENQLREQTAWLERRSFK